MSAFPLLQTTPPEPSFWLGWIVLGVVLVAGLVVGFSDVIRFRFRRVWALSSVCFTESMRRKVLLVTPLAIIGVVVVAQLQQADDDQDAIRQTIKFCLFASSLVVTTTAIILACTNLPREIESRVIFTVVTKPTTRLEIVLGKVVGFARVSAAILLIMGVFTFIYLQIRNHRRMQGVHTTLTSADLPAAVRATLTHYADNGFLETKSLELPRTYSIYSSPPKDGIQWMLGGEAQFFTVPFETTDDERGTLAAAAKQNAEVDLVVNLSLRRRPLTAEDRKNGREMGLLREKSKKVEPLGPALPGTASDEEKIEYPPYASIRVLNEGHAEVLKRESFAQDSFGTRLDLNARDRPVAVVRMAAKDVEALAQLPRFLVETSTVTPGLEYGAGKMPISFFIPAANDGKGMVIKPPMVDGQLPVPEFRSRPGRKGVVITGHPANEVRSIAAFHFRDAQPVITSSGKAAFQLTVGFERTGEFSATASSFSVMAVDVINQKTQKSSGPIRITSELNRVAFFDVPAEDVNGGDFDVLLRDESAQQWVDIDPDSLALVIAKRSFTANLFKSLLLLWLLSILVVSISVFCSTFLSWPIAVVCALVLLLGHWGVAELGDALNPGVGRMVTTDFQVRDPTGSKLVSSSVEGLAKMLKTVSVVLPDVSRFPASEDVERGVDISLKTLGGAVEALLIYGLTLIIAAYIILKYKEVAP